MNITHEKLATLYGSTVYDRNGAKIGSIGQFYADFAGEPTWASVRTGLFGMNESLVPLHEAQLQESGLQLPYDKEMVKEAPNVSADADEPLRGDELAQLYRHYSLDWEAARASYQSGASDTAQAFESTRGFAARDFDEGDIGERDFAEGTFDRAGADEAMTRSEERMYVGKTREETGTARLRKYIVTEQVQTTIPVRHEEVRLEREPITDANREAAYSGPDLTESEHEVTLHAERPVVSRETVPVERVRLDTETVTEEEMVSDEVRKEQIEAEMPDEPGRRRFG